MMNINEKMIANINAVAKENWEKARECSIC